MLEEAEKRKEAAVKNRIKGHEKNADFFFFLSFTWKMCCSWRSHRAEPGRLSPSPPLSPSPGSLPPCVGLEDSPENAHRKSFPPGISNGTQQGREQVLLQRRATWGKAGTACDGCRQHLGDFCLQPGLS